MESRERNKERLRREREREREALRCRYDLGMKNRERQAEIKWADGKKGKVDSDLGCAVIRSEMDVSDDPGFQ